MLPYDLTYTTLDNIRQRKNIIETEDDAMLIRFIRTASDAITTNTGIGFVPYYAVNEYNYPYSRTLQLHMPLLTVESVADVSGVIPSDQYVVQPYNTWPKWTVKLKRSYPAWYYAIDPEASIAITGIWGSNRNALRMWQNVTTLSASLSDSATTVTVTSAAAIGTLAYIKIDDEMLRVSGKSTNTLTLERGVNGTTPAAHDNGAAVALYQINHDIQEACEELTLFLYNNKEMENSANIQILDGTVLVQQQSPRTILDTLAARYQYVGGITL